MLHSASFSGNDLYCLFGFPIATIHLDGFPPAYRRIWCTLEKNQKNKKTPTLNKVI